MSDDMYDDENFDAVRDDEIGPSGRSLMAPDAVALGGLTHHQGANYGEADTTVTVVDGCQCVHDGVAYQGGENADVPAAVAQYWVRSGWATTESDAESDSLDAKPEPVKSPAKAAPPKRQVSAGGGRRSPRR